MKSWLGFHFEETAGLGDAGGEGGAAAEFGDDDAARGILNEIDGAREGRGEGGDFRGPSAAGLQLRADAEEVEGGVFAGEEVAVADGPERAAVGGGNGG